MAARSGGRRPGRRLARVDETSAGGLVVTDSRPAAALVIGRTDRRGRLRWSLPKGHLEPGESAESAAVREVAEETGIVSEVVSPLGTIDFWFVERDRRVHKTVHHFLLRPVAGALSTADHEVTAVEWVALADLTGRLAHSDERDLARRAMEMVSGGTAHA